MNSAGKVAIARLIPTHSAQERNYLACEGRDPLTREKSMKPRTNAGVVKAEAVTAESVIAPKDVEARNADGSTDDAIEAPAATYPPEVQTTQCAEINLPPIGRKGLLTLLAQHVSSSWNARTCEFAFYLFLIELFPNTLLPASIYGFVTTGAAVLLAGSVGGLVDKHARLRIVRIFILIQKFTIVAAGSAFLGLFVAVKPVDYRHAPAAAWVAFAIITLFGCILNLSTIGINVAVERDWVTTISKAHTQGALTMLNANMRRIDLLTKLLAPLFTSLLTTTASYTFATAFIMGFAIISLVFEILWIQVVYKSFPSLAESDRPLPHGNTRAEETKQSRPNEGCLQRLLSTWRDWREFSKMPVFASTVSVSLLYLTVLSFDGTMLSWLKTRQYSDPFIAGQRAICVVTGLAGTLLMPWLEKKIGLVRAGAWSISSEMLALVPVVVTFYVPTQLSSKAPVWSQALLFGGVAASRVGLWAFDLCQLKELQLSLDAHPKRNRFMGLQFSMQNIADLLKYVVTMILSQPQQFRWAALISFIAVCMGTGVYGLYVKLERGHVFHPERIPLFRKHL